tara:strand:- start:102 stop:584 length:483 start_codon:yes stop_codon:yes gene_type:complete
MYKYLTKNGKTSITGGTVLANKTKSDTKVMPKKDKMLQYIDDHLIAYEDKKATPAEAESALKRIESYSKKMSKQDEYNTYFNKKSEKYYNKKKPTSPVEIDFSLRPIHTAGLWKNVKNSSLYKLLDDPKVMGVELGHEGIMETINLLQNSGLLKKGGRVK